MFARQYLVTVGLAIAAGGSTGCSLALRGAAHTTPDTLPNEKTTEYGLQGQLYVPYKEQALFIGTLTPHETSVGASYPVFLFDNKEALVAPQYGLVWRFGDESAIGVEAGGRMHIWKLVLEAGLQHTVGDTGRTGVFGTFGIDVFRLCGCL